MIERARVITTASASAGGRRTPRERSDRIDEIFVQVFWPVLVPAITMAVMTLLAGAAGALYHPRHEPAWILRFLAFGGQGALIGRFAGGVSFYEWGSKEASVRYRVAGVVLAVGAACLALRIAVPGLPETWPYVSIFGGYVLGLASTSVVAVRW